MVFGPSDIFVLIYILLDFFLQFHTALGLVFVLQGMFCLCHEVVGFFLLCLEVKFDGSLG